MVFSLRSRAAEMIQRMPSAWRREKSMGEKLAGEILDAIANQGGAWKRKDDMYRMAQANKAFAHYRW